MAKRDNTGDQPTRRVFKSSDVHKRRVGDSARSKPAKMPTRRQAREAARDSTRIAAEARAGKTEPAEPIEQIDRPEQAEQAERPETTRQAEPGKTARPRFRVVKSAKQNEPQDVTATPPAGDVPADGAVPKDEPQERPVTHLENSPHKRPSVRKANQAVQPQAPEADEPADPDKAEAESPVPVNPRRRPSANEAGKLPHLQPRTIAIAAVMVLAIVLVTTFAFNRWGRYDDHADLQGTWYVLGTEVPITIDATSIRFNEEVSYSYEINDREKTISYTFGPMSGQGRYWFSDDRKHLVITDGEGYTAASTTFDDLVHAFLDFSTATGGGFVELPQGQGIIAFSRTPEKVIVNPPAEGVYAEQSAGAADTQATEGATGSEGSQAAEGQDAGAVDAEQQTTGEGEAGAQGASAGTAPEEQSEGSTSEEEAA